MESQATIHLRIKIPGVSALSLEHARRALRPDDYDGLGVSISCLLSAGEMIYVLTSRGHDVFKLKSVANELLRLLAMLSEVGSALRDYESTK